MLDWFRRRIWRGYEDDDDPALQGGSSTMEASMKTAIIFIAPMWVTAFTLAFIPPVLGAYGWQPMMVWILQGTMVILSIMLPMLGYLIQMNSRITYLSGRDIFHALLRWSGRDWDPIDLVTRGDPVLIADNMDLTMEKFVERVEDTVEVMRHEEEQRREREIAKREGRGEPTRRGWR